MTPKEAWSQSRLGKFSCSENYKLLTGGKKGELFGEGATTYIEQKAMEAGTMLWECAVREDAKSLRHGKQYEMPAFNAFVKLTRNYSMKYLGTDDPLFLDSEVDGLKGEVGGSPDAINITASNSIDCIAEFKCPYNPINQFRRLFWKDQADLKKEYLSCYTQIQNLLMVANCDIAFFVSYDERRIKESERLKIIEVKPDKQFQDNLDIRLRMAIKEKYKILSELS